METLIVVRLLVRRWPLVALGGLLAIVAAAVVSGKAGVGPFAQPPNVTWYYITDSQVDTPSPLVADAYASASGIQTQSALLADYLTSDSARDEVARRAGIAPAQLAISVPAVDEYIRQSPLVQGALANAGTSAAYQVFANPWAVSPLISLVASGPDKAVAARVSRAATDVLVAGSGPRSSQPQLVVRQLGKAQVQLTVSGGPTLVLGVVAAFFVFVGWCAAIVIGAGLMRFWRVSMTEPAATAH